MSCENKIHKKGKCFWGPPAWTTLHSIAVTYEPQHAESFKMLITSLLNLLCCIECRTNLRNNLRALPIDRYLGSNESLFYWTYLLHDKVNREISKKYNIEKKSPPYEYVRKYYFDKVNDSGCTNCTL